MVSAPQKELRFTRSGQAVAFCVLGAVCFGIAVTLLATSIYRPINPELPHPAWIVPCFAMAFAAFWLARHLTLHAYLILTPMGLEIFPFYRPAKGMQMVLWQEISAVDADKNWLSLHFNNEKTSGMHLSIGPVRKNLRPLLIKAITSRVNR